MATNLLEAYKARLAVADKVFSNKNNGSTMDNSRKILVAQMLKNTTDFLNESLANSFGTQRGDMGAFRKFTINLVNIATPTLIAPELVLVHPMDAITGYVAYMKYTYGSQKGDVAQGDVFNTPFKLDSSKVDGTYTSSRVRMTRTGTGASETISLDWSPVEPGSVVIRFGTTVYADIDRDGVLYAVTNATETEIDIGKSQTRTVVSGTKGSSVGTVTYGTTADGRIPTSATADKGYLPYNQGAQWDTTSNPIKGSVTITSGITSSTPYTLTYVYDNAYIPQNDVPMLNGEMDGIHLKAEPHRIQIYYSNLAAFQAKSDYGFDLGENLAKQAVAQLQYDMDTLVVDGLSDAAGTENTSLVWSKTLPIGVSKTEHYAGFAEVFELGKQIIYDRTGKFAPNYMVAASSLMPVLAFVPGFKAASTTNVVGPYFAGTLNGVKIYVSPKLKDGRFFFGVNGSDAYTSAAILGMYLPAMPTQLLGFADGAMNQGFSSMYDFEILNKDLLVAGKVTE